MNMNNGKYAWMVKIGEKGQFVIPKAKQQDTIKQVFSEIEE